METNLRLCKVCSILKPRVLAGKWKKDNKWTDNEGNLWSGSTCPECNKNRLKLTMRIKRTKTDKE